MNDRKDAIDKTNNLIHGIAENKPFYRIQWFCPVCDKSHETVGHFPKPRIHCGDCLMKYHQIVEMVFESAEQLPDEPMVNLKVVGPDGEMIEGDEDEMVESQLTTDMRKLKW